jgi:hypothetical protein
MYLVTKHSQVKNLDSVIADELFDGKGILLGAEVSAKYQPPL